MKLPSFLRIFKTDFEPDDQPLIEKLGDLLNTAIESVYQALNKNISISENLLATVADVDVIVNDSGIPITAATFVLDISTRVQGLTVINAAFVPASAADGVVYPSGGINITWSQNKKNIQLNQVTGLPANKRFRLRIIAFG